MGSGISIHLAPLVLFHIGSFPVTNTLVMTVLVSLFLIIVSFFIGRSLKLKPTGFQAVIELLVTYPYQFVRETLGNDKVAERIYPLVMTIFLLVLFSNWFGLLPITENIGVYGTGAHEIVPFFYSGATDLNFTLALGIIAFFSIEFFGVTTIGALKYAKKFISFKSPMAFVIGFIELISELARLISFSFRLFGNIFAGKVLILVIMLFIPYVVPVPLMAFETFVGFIQAAIFALLTLFFTKVAIEMHEEEEADHLVREEAKLIEEPAREAKSA